MGCTTTSQVKTPNDGVIQEIQDKVNTITYNIPDELLEECQWFYPVSRNTQEGRVVAITENLKRQEECYYLNDAKLQFLKALRHHNNER